jgi:hypothetical protein
VYSNYYTQTYRKDQMGEEPLRIKSIDRNVWFEFEVSVIRRLILSQMMPLELS